MPAFGFGDAEGAADPKSYYDLWWIVISTITLGVGIGVLAQPQLVVRFMTVRSRKELNRAVLVGGVFILIMTGVAFTVGSLSNVYFMETETVTGTLLREADGKVIVKRQRNINAAKDPDNPDVVALPARLLYLDVNGDETADVHLIASAPGKLQAIMPKAVITPTGYQVGDTVTVQPRASAYMRALVPRGKDTVECMTSRIIPTYIGSAMPKWFGLVFLLTLLAAAMSTLSSQFHALGTAIGRDVFEQATGRREASIGVTRIGILVGIVIAVLISYMNPGGGFIIARATAIFFGLCASAFLPAFLGGLLFRRVTKAGAIASMIVGFLVTAFWLLLVKDAEAAALGLVFKVTGGKPSILADHATWHVVDPIIVALPASLIVMIVVSLLTKPPAAEHVERCFGRKK